MSDYKGEIRKTCPYHKVPTIKIAAANFISYDMDEARAASRTMLKIVEKLRDRVLSTDPKSISYKIEDFDTIGNRSKAHDNFYPATLEDILPIDPNKNATALFEKVNQSNNYHIQQIVVQHLSHLAVTGSHVKSAREVIESDMKKYKKAPLADLTLDDVRTLIDYQTIQERPETSAPIIAFNALISRRPDIIQEILRVQAQICTALQEMIAAEPQLQYEDLAYSEIGFVENGRVFPNSRFTKILANNYGPYFDKYRDQSADDILSHSSLDAEKDRIFAQRLLLFNQNIDSYSLIGTDHRACPAIQSIGPMIRHLTL